MEHLEIRLFGRLEIRRDNVLLPAFATRKSERLFAFLVLNGTRPVSREILCGQFWGDQGESEAKKALRTELWRVRAVLEPHEGDRGAFLRVDGHVAGLADTPRTWVDTAEFEAGVRVQGANGQTALDDAQAARLETAAALYRGDFLEGHYDEWSLFQRERLRLVHLAALERLVAHYRATGQWLEAIVRGRQLLRDDPIREHIHRAVMAACLAMGDRPSAVRQYQSCVRTLREELDLEPMDETRRLHETIRDGAPTLANGAASGNGSAGRGDMVRIVAEVDSLLGELYALAERLQQTRATFAAGCEAP